jgi:hypothetical protein
MTRPALRAPRHATPVLLFVVALHLLMGALLASLGVWPDRVAGGHSSRPQPEPPPLTVWLLRQIEGRSLPAPTPPPAQRAAPQALRKPLEQAQAITLPVITNEGAGEPPAPAAAPAAAQEAQPQAPAETRAAPLNLTLPRAASAPWRQRNPVLDDTRGRSARATFESLLAGAMGGDGRWTEERIDNDRIRFRRGNTCVELERSRSERIDSFNSSYSPKPWLAGKASPC